MNDPKAWLNTLRQGGAVVDDPKAWLDMYFLDLPRLREECEEQGEPGCFFVYRTRPLGNGPGDEIVGEPLAIFRTREGLYRGFVAIAKKLDKRWGISVGCWWFDDDKEVQS